MNTFPLQIVTPDGSFFDSQAAMIRLRTIEGDVAVMAGHLPYVTAIGIGECRVQLPDGSDRYAACCGGLLSVGDAVRVVAGTFEWADQIDISRARTAYERARQKLDSFAPETDPVLIANAQEHLKRAQNRLRVADRVLSGR